MLQHTTRRACAVSLKHTNRFRWSERSLVQASNRLRSTEPAAASNLSVWANVDPSLAIDRRGTIEDAEAVTNAADDGDTPVFLTTTRVGREVSRIVQSSQDVLHPEIVDLMVRSVDRRSSDAFDTFALIAKAHGKIGRSHLTLHLCEAVQRRTGQPLVPSTPKGLVLLLEAMQPKVLRHVHKTANSVGGEREVQDVLRRYESEGKVVPLEGYMAAVKALNASGLCSAAIQVAQDARSKLGESTKGMDELYSLVMRQCSEHREPDAMLRLLKEREDAGGLLTPDARLYAATLGCLGKAGRVSDALELMRHMVDRGQKPDEIAVNNVLAACARDASTYWEHAKSLFEGMETLWGVTPNVYHYTSLVTCLLKAGQWSNGIAMTDKMEADGIIPNVRFLDHMMQASVGARQWATAEAIFRAMTEKYGHPAVVSKQSTLHFIQSMVMQKKLRKAISYVSRIQYIKLEGKAAKVSLDVHLLKCFRTIPGVGSDALAGVLMTMADLGVQLHADSYSVVIAKANQDGNKKLSENLYKMLVMGRGAPSLSAANAAIKGCSDIDSALDIVQSLSEHKLVPDKFTYAALLHCCSKAQGDERVGDKATQVWEAMLQDGIVPHGGMLACYLQSLMRAGGWKAAAEVRERYRRGEELSRAEKHVDKFDYMAREDAVVDGVMANGLIENGQHRLALEYVLEVLDSRAKENASLENLDQEYYVDEDNHTVLAGIRACRVAGSCETAMGLLDTCEARWAKGPLVRDGQAKGHEWREMTIRTRESRRRLYDCLVSLMEEKGAKSSDIRGVLEKGMRNGAISLMKDEQGGNTAEQAIEFHGWSPQSASCVLRCIIEDIGQTDSDFLLSNGQYDLGRVVSAQGVREFGEVSERWHNDSPDPRGRRREFADGVKPARFEEREYGKGRRGRRREKLEGVDGEQAFWWKAGVRLSMIVGKPRPPPSIRHSLETFCTLGVQPPLRIRQDAANPGLLNIEPEDVRAWLKQGGTILGPC